MLTDAQWTELEPVVETCRPRGKTQPKNLRRTISAILWRHRYRTTWRAVPPELGPWWLAAQTFIRWARLGVWERLLDLVQASGDSPGAQRPGCTVAEGHRAAASAATRGDLGPSEILVTRLATRVCAVPTSPPS